jgi:ketopantoate hydroxymethyltransferase
MMHKLLVFGITCMILGAAMNVFLLITSKAAGQQQIQQPQFTDQFAQQQRQQQEQQQRQQQQLNQQRFPNQQQQGQVLDQQK